MGRYHGQPNVPNFNDCIERVAHPLSNSAVPDALMYIATQFLD